MCAKVIFLSPEGYEKVPPIVCFSPADLESFGLDLIGIPEEIYDDCWCVNDPEPTLLANGYIFEIDNETGNYFCKAIAAVPTLSLSSYARYARSESRSSSTSYEF